MDTRISETNIGYRLLQKMGWKAGEGLGAGGRGRTDPIRIDYKEDSLGVGKAEEEQSYHTSSTAKRKTMDSEKMLEESQTERAYRESKAEKQQAIHKEIKDVTRAFYCELCDKQYSKVIDYDKHLQSYDHHHKKRFKDMKESTRKSSFAQSAKDKKRERERKREERERQKMEEAIMKQASRTQKEPSEGSSRWKPMGAAVAKPSSGGWAQMDEPRSSAQINQGWTTAASAPTGAWNSVEAPRGGSSIPVQNTGGWTTTTMPSSLGPPPSLSSSPPASSHGSPLPPPPSSSSAPSSGPAIPSAPSAVTANHNHGTTGIDSTSGAKPNELPASASKLTFGIPKKKAGGFQFGLKKKS
ncbi:hypothetical protein BCR43DRAFT_169560 [Syncephalastrum racemosum]|uniref:G-patch domain-containing protein n=1 Tax=Syncephalastrum racemosum TaxID=13706 RepID=A0A1X2HP84_SYNRA|nr:hypothetical protein BCR43DRAFT_169560 [Syncephalastrum racemosum]